MTLEGRAKLSLENLVVIVQLIARYISDIIKTAIVRPGA